MQFPVEAEQSKTADEDQEEEYESSAESGGELMDSGDESDKPKLGAADSRPVEAQPTAPELAALQPVPLEQLESKKKRAPAKHQAEEGKPKRQRRKRPTVVQQPPLETVQPAAADDDDEEEPEEWKKLPEAVRQKVAQQVKARQKKELRDRHNWDLVSIGAKLEAERRKGKKSA